jgi:sugar O-acyltransferase (sialic acid O-acetyltransferase NeuD family)
MQPVVIIGAGGFAREVLDIFDAANAVRPSYDVLGYIVEPEYGAPGAIVNGKPILGGFDWFAGKTDSLQAICAVGVPELRRRLTNQARLLNVRFCNVIHPTAILTRHIQMGEGVVITAGCILTNQIRIADHVHVNLDCTIGHDAVLEDFATLAPGVHVSGKVALEEGCYVGTGANIIDKKRIGAWSVVGAGSVITADVPPNTTVVGVPGKVVKMRAEGWHL